MDRQTFWGITLLILVAVGAMSIIGAIIYGAYSIFK